jgi:aspartate/methionine/tyrosine aminotransferase
MLDGRIPLDLAFCRWMAVEIGVAFMPLSSFYKIGSPYTRDNFVRLAICKDQASIEQCIKRLRDRLN